MTVNILSVLAANHLAQVGGKFAFASAHRRQTKNGSSDYHIWYIDNAVVSKEGMATHKTWLKKSR